MLTELRQELDLYCNSYSDAQQPKLLRESFQKIQKLGQQLNNREQTISTLTFLQSEIRKLENNSDSTSEVHITGIKILMNIEKALIDEFLKLSPTEQEFYLSNKDIDKSKALALVLAKLEHRHVILDNIKKRLDEHQTKY